MPTVRRLEKEYNGRITFTRVNVLRKESRALIEQYNFGTSPEFYLVDGQGNLIGVWDDTLTADDLREAFDAALAAEQ